MTPECLLSETSLLVSPHACSLQKWKPVPSCRCSGPRLAATGRNEHWRCSSDLGKVEWESAESERRTMDGSKQSNSAALLYGKRTHMCLGWMMCLASALCIPCSRFSHVAFLRMYFGCRGRERELCEQTARLKGMGRLRGRRGRQKKRKYTRDRGGLVWHWEAEERSQLCQAACLHTEQIDVALPWSNDPPAGSMSSLRWHVKAGNGS